MRVSAIQMEIGQKLEINLENARDLIRKAASTGARIVCLPEYFAIPPFPSSSKIDLPFITNQTFEMTFQMIQEASLQNNLCIVGGSLFRQRQDGLYYNSCPVFDKGNLLAFQDKIHVTSKEHSWGLNSGVLNGLQVFNVDGINVSVVICADILFPKTIATIRDQNADLLFIPLTSPLRKSDLTQKYRDCLFVARAFDTNVYVIKTGSVGKTASGVNIAGRSLIAGPHGVMVKAESETEEEILTIDLNIPKLEEMDLYPQLFGHT